MDFKNCAKRLSGRLFIREQNEEDVFAGSGILYVAPNTAYFFTAAHVLTGEAYKIEFYHSADDAERAEDYQYVARKEDFHMHPSWKTDVESQKFHSCDIAGIQIEKRDWMCEISPWRILAPRTNMALACYGYPGGSYDGVIQFAGYFLKTSAEEVSIADHRMLCQFSGQADFSDLGKALEGMSGAGIICAADEADDVYLVGLIQSGQGSSMRLGRINAVLAERIVDLCLSNDWTVPKSCVEYANDLNAADEFNQKIDNEFKEGTKKESNGTGTGIRKNPGKIRSKEVGDIAEAAVQSAEAEIRAAQMSEYVSGKIQRIKADIRNMQIRKALDRCAEEKSDESWRYCTDDRKCYLLWLEARCHSLLGDMEKAESCLMEAEGYDAPGKCWVCLEYSNLELMKNNISAAEKLVDEALQYSSENKQAYLLKCYITAIQMDCGLEERLDYLSRMFYGVSGGIQKSPSMDSQGSAQDILQLFYSMQAALCEGHKEKKRAIHYYKMAYAVQGDKAYLLYIARLYYLLAMEQTPNDLIALEKASIHYMSYLGACDEALRAAFYVQDGFAFIQCEYLLKNQALLLEHIDKVIEAQTDAKMFRDLIAMKADTQLCMEIIDSATISLLDEKCRKNLLRHYENTKAMGQYTQLLNRLRPIWVDYEHRYYHLRPMIQSLLQGLEACREEIRRQVDITVEVIRESSNTEAIESEGLKVSREEAPCYDNYRRGLYLDILDALLLLHDAERYRIYLNEFVSEYPECREERIHFELMLGEAEGEAEQTEKMLLLQLEQNPTPQNFDVCLRFYFRNCRFSDMNRLYEKLLADPDGAGQLGRDALILQYCSDLLEAQSTRLQSIQVYLKYEKEIQNATIRDVLDMRFRFYTRDYSNYKNWLKISDEWIRKEPQLAQEEFRNAIRLCVYNLDDALARIYYSRFMSNFYPEQNPDEMIPAEAGIQTLYFALVSPGRGKKQTNVAAKTEQAMKHTAETLGCMLRQTAEGQSHVVWQTTAEPDRAVWQTAEPDRAMQRSEGKKPDAVILDALALYYLASHDLLEEAGNVWSSFIVTYATVEYFLQAQAGGDDPTIRRAFGWIRTAGIVELREPSMKCQVKFRGGCGEQNWICAGNYCMADEMGIPVIYAGQPDRAFLEKNGIKAKMVWVGVADIYNYNDADMVDEERKLNG